MTVAINKVVVPRAFAALATFCMYTKRGTMPGSNISIRPNPNSNCSAPSSRPSCAPGGRRSDFVSGLMNFLCRRFVIDTMATAAETGTKNTESTIKTDIEILLVSHRGGRVQGIRFVKSLPQACTYSQNNLSIFNYLYNIRCIDYQSVT